MNINKFFFHLQEDYENYQSLCAAEDMYSVPAKTARSR
jgi:hypothetical protein